MKANYKRILSLLLALVMILTTAFMASNTYATDDAEPDAEVQETIEEQAADIAEEILDAIEEVPAEEAPASEEIEAVAEPDAAPAEAPEEAAPAAVVPYISAQPQNTAVKNGETAVFTVDAVGNVSNYQWQLSKDGGLIWANLSFWAYGSKAELSYVATALSNGYLFRCVITYADGQKAVTEAAKLTVGESFPAQKLEIAEEVAGAQVSVDAPEGALPEGAELEVVEVAAEEVEDQVAAVTEGTTADMLALDISFTTGEPNAEVEVTITSEKIAANADKDFSLIHIKDNGEVEVIEDVKIEGDTLVFTSDEFSTYVLQWKDGEEDKSAQIHWGQMKDGAWTEFDKTNVDESTGTSSLRGLYDGYTFVRAYYSASALEDPTTGTIIESFITRSESGSWQYAIGENNYDIADGAHIYALYVENGSEGAPPVIPAPEGNDPLNTQKKVEANKNADGTPDGTYKITLSVTGDQVVTEEPKKANVVLVLDQSISMQEHVSGNSSPYRYAAVRDAANTLIDKMPTGGTIDMCIVTFGTGSATPREWMTINSTSDQTTLKNAVTTAMNNANQYGTNWDSGLNRAKTEADKKASENESTFIVFLTDGCPSVYGNNQHSHGSAGTTDPNDLCLSNALTRMNAIVGAKYIVYGIYANTTSNNTRVTANGVTYTDPLAYILTVSNAGSVGGGYTQASDASALTAVFDNIASNILTYLGYNNVSVNDGVTDLTNVSAAVSTAGPAGNFVYTRDGGTNLDGTKKYDNEVWTNAPTALTSDTGVTWDLASAGNLEAGVTYSVSFDIWPSQEAYDLIADLNNGVKVYEAGHSNSITDEERAQVGGTGPNGYYLLTNTFLNTTYTFEGDPDTTYTVQGDKGTNAMPLDSEVISLLKFWPENQLDDYIEGHSQDGLQNQITLTVTKDGATYISKTLVKSDENPDTGWIPATGQEDVFISCGVMTVKDGVVEIKAGSEGHDYTITEPGIFSYYWDLIADVYHPMVINGKKTMLVLDKTKTAQDVANGVYQIGVDEKGKPKYYRTEMGTTTVGDDGSTITTFYMRAYNYRRSNLNLTKEIVDACDVADTAYFEYEVVITDAAGEDVWFSAFDPTIEYEDEETHEIKHGATVKDTDWVISGATAEAGNTGYWHAKSGATIKIKIKAGWNVRFLNLLHDSTFSFTETGMDDGFTFNNITTGKKFDFTDTTHKPDDWITANSTDDQKLEGVILEPNNSYTVTFKNNYTTYFYVYHSSDNTIEKIANTDKRVTKADDGSMKFDIVSETKTGMLYGGYYQAYAGAKLTDEQIVKSTGFTSGWLTDTGATPYDASKANIWIRTKAYTDNIIETGGGIGTSMTPKANIVYYLKEVPNGYIRPYIHFTYDNYREDKPLKKLYVITAADDTNYTNVGYLLGNAEEMTACATRSLVITITKPDGTYDTKLTASSIYSNKEYHGDTVTLSRGYLWWTDFSSSIGKEFTFRPCWTTLDGVQVKGVTVRTVNNGTTYNTGNTATDIAVTDVKGE